MFTLYLFTTELVSRDYDNHLRSAGLVAELRDLYVFLCTAAASVGRPLLVLCSSCLRLLPHPTAIPLPTPKTACTSCDEIYKGQRDIYRIIDKTYSTALVMRDQVHTLVGRWLVEFDMVKLFVQGKRRVINDKWVAYGITDDHRAQKQCSLKV